MAIQIQSPRSPSVQTQSIQIQFLGSGDAFGSGGRLQTCLLVTTPSGRVLVDCGASSLIGLRRQGIDPAALDAVLLSHLHGDHFGGIPFLVLDAQLISRRTRPLTILGPPGVEQRVLAAMEALFPGSTQVQRHFEMVFREWREGQPEALRELQATPYPVQHPSGAPPFALRLECQGRVVTYSGDTEWCAGLAEAAHGADLFICEGYSFDKPIKFHLSVQTLREHLPALACRRVILTHMSQDVLSRLPLPELAAAGIETAEDGLVVEV